MSGNICRCGAYPNIVAAILQVMNGARGHDQLRLHARERHRRGGARRDRRSEREVHRRRHQPDRPDEGGRRAADAADRHHASAAEGGRGDGGRRPEDRRARAEQRSRLSPDGRKPLSAARRARSSPAPRSSCATWRRPAAICCSGRAAIISTTSRRPATSASRASGCSAIDGVNRQHAILGASEPASRRIRRTCASRWPRSMRPCMCSARRASARSRSPTSIACPATRRSATPICSPPRSSRRSSCRPKGSRRTTPI